MTTSVLLIEDNAADVFLIREALREYSLDIQLTVIEDGEKAMRCIEELSSSARPKAVLLDLNLPRRGGEEILRCIRSKEGFHDIPVLILTSSDSPKDRSEVARLGASYYFQKPSDYDEFMKIGEVLEKLLQPTDIT